MAEYVEVMKQKKRMCNSTLCCKCDIFYLAGENIGNCQQFISNNPSKAEEIIMSWAAEHPIVYPTWVEWLVDSGVLPQIMSTIPSVALNTIRDSLSVEIPADMAQTLGIEPKNNF